MKIILPAIAAASLIATPTLAASEPSTALVDSSYRIDAGDSALFAKGTVLTAYAEQDEAAPAPEKKKKSKTLLYVGIGVVVLVGLLYVVANNTVVMPDGTLDGF